MADLKSPIFFDNSFSLPHLQFFFTDIVANIKKGNTIYVDSIISAFIPVLQLVQPDSAFYNLSNQFFQYLFLKKPEIKSLLKVVACFDVMNSKLPLSLSFDQIFNLDGKEAQIIHQYVHNEYISKAVKCLAISLSIPSAHFSSSFSFAKPEKHSMLPDPNIMLENYECFNDEELYYACQIVQYANNLIFEIGSQKDHLTIEIYRNFQDLILNSELTIGALSNAILIHTTQPTTVGIVRNIFKNMDNATGIELLKELFLLNTTKSFVELIKRFSFMPISILHENSDRFNQYVIDLINPFYPSIEKLEGTILSLVNMVKNDEDKQKILPFLGTFYSILLRISYESLLSTFKIILDNFESISLIIHTFFEMMVLEPQFNKSKIIHLIICIVSLIYYNLNKFNVYSISSQMLESTIQCIYYFMFIEMDDKSFLFFDMQKAFSEISKFVTFHKTVFKRYVEKVMPKMLFPAAAVIGTIIHLSPTFVFHLISQNIFSFLVPVFIGTRNAVLKTKWTEQTMKLFFDLFLTLSNSEELDPSIKTHVQTSYILILADIIQRRDEYLLLLLSHPMFDVLYNALNNIFEIMKFPDPPILTASLHFLRIIFDNAIMSYYELPKLQLLLSNIEKLSQTAVDELLALTTLVAQGQETFPYEIDWTLLHTSKATDKQRFYIKIKAFFPDFAFMNDIIDDVSEVSTELSELTANGPKNRNKIPWIDPSNNLAFLTSFKPYAVLKRNTPMKDFNIISDEYTDEEEEEDF